MKKLLIALVRFLLGTTIFALLFVGIADLSLDKLLVGTVEDVYDYSDEGVRQQTVRELIGYCVDIEEHDREIRALCDDPPLLEQAREACAQGLVTEGCDTLDIDLDAECAFFDDKLRKACARQGSDKAFLVNFVLTLADRPEAQLETGQFLFPLLFLLIALVGTLYLLHRGNLSALFFSLGRSLFLVGIISLLTVGAIALYLWARPPDTTFIMATVVDGFDDSVVSSAVGVLVPLVMRRLFSSALALAGLVLAVFGVVLKIVFRKGKG